MNARAFAHLIAVGFAVSNFAHANDAGAIGRVALVCPDRSLRTADIELAAQAARWSLSPTATQQMLERARSMCAAGLTAATLTAPESPIDREKALVDATR